MIGEQLRVVQRQNTILKIMIGMSFMTFVVVNGETVLANLRKQWIAEGQEQTPEKDDNLSEDIKEQLVVAKSISKQSGWKEESIKIVEWHKYLRTAGNVEILQCRPDQFWVRIKTPQGYLFSNKIGNSTSMAYVPDPDHKMDFGKQPK